MTRAIVISEAMLGESLLIDTGNVLRNEQPDVVAAGKSTLYIFSYANGLYQLAQTIAVEQNILSLAVGLPMFGTGIIIVGTEDRLLAYGNKGGTISFLWQTSPEPEAQFNALVLADLDGDGRQELAATARNNQSLYVYILTGQTLETSGNQLLAIRQLPGEPTAITAFRPNMNQNNYLAIAYKNQGNGIQTLILTDRGFAEGPSVRNLSYQIMDLTAANLLPSEGEELAAASSDGSVKMFHVNMQLTIELVTNNLGSTVSAVDAKTFNGDKALLVAGTPGNYVFGFTSPSLSNEPNWAYRAPGPIHDLVIIEATRIALGTKNGVFQILELINT